MLHSAGVGYNGQLC